MMNKTPTAFSYSIEPVKAADPNKRHFTPQVFLYWLFALAGALMIFTALQHTNEPLWLFNLKPALDPRAPDDVGVALGPILALALMIERVIETIFDVFERNWQQVARYGSAASDGADHLNKVLGLYNTQLKSAMDEMETALGNKTDPASPAALETLMQKVDAAEMKVREASDKLAAMVRDPKYLAWKRTITIWTGLVLGLIVAIVSDVGVFEHLNIRVPRMLDMLVTGFVIGAGSGPMHSLIGILQSAKSTLDNVGSFTGLGAIQDQLEELKSAMRNRPTPPPAE